jgi:hypothetical protein
MQNILYFGTLFLRSNFLTVVKCWTQFCLHNDIAVYEISCAKLWQILLKYLSITGSRAHYTSCHLSNTTEKKEKWEREDWSRQCTDQIGHESSTYRFLPPFVVRNAKFYTVISYWFDCARSFSKCSWRSSVAIKVAPTLDAVNLFYLLKITLQELGLFPS